MSIISQHNREVKEGLMSSASEYNKMLKYFDSLRTGFACRTRLLEMVFDILLQFTN